MRGSRQEGPSEFKLTLVADAPRKVRGTEGGVGWGLQVASVCVLHLLSCVRLFATPWTITPQAPLSTGFPRQEYWSGLPCLLPGDRHNPRIEPMSPASPALQADSLSPSHQKESANNF